MEPLALLFLDTYQYGKRLWRHIAYYLTRNFQGILEDVFLLFLQIESNQKICAVKMTLDA